jgi:hypothetical protein
MLLRYRFVKRMILSCFMPNLLYFITLPEKTTLSKKTKLLGKHTVALFIEAGKNLCILFDAGVVCELGPFYHLFNYNYMPQIYNIYFVSDHAS